MQFSAKPRTGASPSDAFNVIPWIGASPSDAVYCHIQDRSLTIRCSLVPYPGLEPHHQMQFTVIPRIGVDYGVMAILGYSIFSKASGMEPYHLIV